MVRVNLAFTLCPRCHRQIMPWPLRRPATCSSPSWAYCIRNDIRPALTMDDKYPLFLGREGVKRCKR